jgi:hypothetical protein
MGGKYVFSDAPFSSEWIVVGCLILPLIMGLLLGVAFACLIRWRGWPPNVISIIPISIMLGVLSYVAVAILVVVPKLVVSDYTVHAFLFGTTIALFFTWPIALVMVPIFLIYIWFLKKGRKLFKDSTVFYIAVLCLVSELAFVALFFGDPSW